MAAQVIAVLGATGAQGGGVVDALLKDGQYRVRAAVRNPASDAAKLLAKRGVELVKADILDIGSMGPVFEVAYGVFVVTNFWDPAQMRSETAIGTALVNSAHAFGVHHAIWSTLPDCEKLSEGRFKVPHFSGKARVDAAVEAAGFSRYTFVQAPMYFQNFLNIMRPEPLPSGGRGWAVPMDPAARVIHAGDVTEVGRAVAAAFTSGDKLPNGSYLDVCGGTYSWDDFAAALNGLGHEIRVIQVPADAYKGAHELREWYQYCEQYTHFGPECEKRIAAANALVPAGFTGFADWAKIHMNQG